MRAFIAIELPATTQNVIQKQTAHLRQTLGDDLIRWVPTYNTHITLKFLGDVASTHVDFLKQMLAREANIYSEFDIQFGSLGSFPTSKRPRVLWIGFHPPASLASLQGDIESEATRLGYKKEERAFSPHLTIGRVRREASSMDLQKIRAVWESIQLGNIPAARVDSVHLFKSDLKPTGSVYTKLFTVKLRHAETSTDPKR